MKVMDVIFIGMLFLMTISIVSHGHNNLYHDLKEVKSICRSK